MSLHVQTLDGKSVEAHFIHGGNKAHVEGVRIGEHEMPLSDFCAMAQHFLHGGFFGWADQGTPAPVNLTLENLFNLYERKDGSWVRKNL